MDLTQLLSRLRGSTRNQVTTFEGGRAVERSFDAVARDVERVRDRLGGLGVRPGMRVGIRAPNCYAWLVHDLALLELRAVCVAFTDDFQQVEAAQLCDRYALSLLLVPPEDSAVDELDHVAALVVEDAPPAVVREPPPGILEEDEPYHHPWLVFSSGSAGGIKGLVIDRRGIEQSVDAFAQTAGVRPDDRVLLFLPLSNFQQRLIYYQNQCFMKSSLDDAHYVLDIEWLVYYSVGTLF